MLNTHSLCIFESFLVHAEIMTELMNHCEPDLCADFGLRGAHRFDVLLVEHDVVRPRWQIEDTLLCHGHAVEEPEQELLRV